MLLLVRPGRLSIVIVSVALVLVLAIEISGRFLNWPQPYDMLFEYDEKTGFRNPQGENIRIKSGEYVYQLTFDADGFLDRSGHDPYVIVLGDGVVAGVELRPQERISYLLVQGGLSGSINLSVTGFGTLQQVLTLEETMLRGRAGRGRTVILIYNLANDLIDNIRDWEGPMVPGARLTSPREILPPDYPSLPYRLSRQIYLRSYTLQRINNLVTRANRQRGVIAPCVIGSKLDCELALITAGEAFKRLHALAIKYSLNIHGFFWNDLEIKPDHENEVAELMRRIEEMSSFITWHGRLEPWLASDDDNKKWLVPGTRHANARATHMIADQVLKTISVNLSESHHTQ